MTDFNMTVCHSFVLLISTKVHFLIYKKYNIHTTLQDKSTIKYQILIIVQSGYVATSSMVFMCSYACAAMTSSREKT
jgi:hypothetical protein